MAFCVDKKNKDEVIKYLDYREKSGYQLTEMLFHPIVNGGKPYNVLVYMATQENPDYLGPAPESEIARQILSCVGPSGPNLDYFHNLVESLEHLGLSYVDSHLRTIKTCIEKLTRKNMK